MSTRKALKWVAIWIGISLCFNIGIYIFLGSEKALEYFGGYVIEQSLSVDNLFLFIMVFSAFGIKREYQRRVLNYGIAGAIILRLLFVVVGVTIVNSFHFVLYIFGGILILGGVNMMLKKDTDQNFQDSRIIKTLGKIIPITDTLEGNHFFIKRNKVRYATPLFAILILIEFTDILFAIDSIPAIFSITTDTFIVYTSNIFAILGLRNLYFLLEGLHERFRYVKFGVASILVFTGFKLCATFFDLEIPIIWSLFIISIILIGSIITSILFTQKKSGLQGVSKLIKNN